MIKTWCIAPDCNGIIDQDQKPLGEFIQETLNYWNEETSLQVFILTDENDHPLATMLRDDSDHEIAYVTYSDGTFEKYRAHYVLDEQGSYVRTEVTRL
jgi:hypothetical protein